MVRWVLLLSLGLTQAAEAQIVSYATQTDVARLIELTGAVQGAEQMITIMTPPMIDLLRSSHPDLPERAFAIAQEVLVGELRRRISEPGGLIEKMIPIYERYYTADEVRGLIVFFESPLGRKMVSIMPALMQEGAAVGQQWGTEVVPVVEAVLRERLKQEGYLE